MTSIIFFVLHACVGGHPCSTTAVACPTHSCIICSLFSVLSVFGVCTRMPTNITFLVRNDLLKHPRKAEEHRRQNSNSSLCVVYHTLDAMRCALPHVPLHVHTTFCAKSPNPCIASTPLLSSFGFVIFATGSFLCGLQVRYFVARAALAVVLELLFFLTCGNCIE